MSTVFIYFYDRSQCLYGQLFHHNNSLFYWHSTEVSSWADPFCYIRFACNNTPLTLSCTYLYPIIQFLKSMTLTHAYYHYTHASLAMAFDLMNADKSDAVVIGYGQFSTSLSCFLHVDVSGTSVALSDKVKLLGVILDRRMTLDKTLTILPFCSFSHQSSLPCLACYVGWYGRTVSQALGSLWFYYMNSILYGASKYNILKIHQAQNAFVWVLTQSHRRKSANTLWWKFH